VSGSPSNLHALVVHAGQPRCKGPELLVEEGSVGVLSEVLAAQIPADLGWLELCVGHVSDGRDSLPQPHDLVWRRKDAAAGAKLLLDRRRGGRLRILIVELADQLEALLSSCKVVDRKDVRSLVEQPYAGKRDVDPVEGFLGEVGF